MAGIHGSYTARRILLGALVFAALGLGAALGHAAAIAPGSAPGPYEAHFQTHGETFAATASIGDVAEPSPSLAGATLHVPAQYTSIQAAIDAAVDGDTVLVSPGTYVENLTLSGKTITLASLFHTTQDPSMVDQTIIDGSTATVITVDDTVGPATSIIGFTIRNGEDGIRPFGDISILHNRITDTSDGIDYEGGGGICRFNVFEFNSDDGIDLDGSSAVIMEENIIVNNGDDGIEIRLQAYTGPTLDIVIRDNVISGNDEDGIQLIDYPGLSDRHFLIEHNLIESNAMVGIGLMDNADTNEDFRAASIPEPIHVFDNTLVGNPYGLTGGDNLVAVNNLFVDSTTMGIKETDGGSIAAYNLFWNNGTDQVGSNIDVASTLFVDPLLDADARLQNGSPAIDSGTAFFEWQGQTVLDRPPDSYQGANPDLGAFESDFVGNAGPSVSVSVSPASVVEDGTSDLVYTFTRTHTIGALAVDFTVTGTAALTTDYTQSGADTFTATNGSVTIPDGFGTAQVTIDPVADNDPEPDETVELTITPGSGYIVGSPATATGTISDDDAPVRTEVNAESETTLFGSVTAGDHTSTHDSDDTYEQVTEQRTSGNPRNRVSSLEHEWTFSVPAGDTVTFSVEAYRTANGENDDFTFAYSLDGNSYVQMLTVSKTSDDGVLQEFQLPSGTAGTIRVRARDTDRTPGNGGVDTLYIDHLFFLVETIGGPPQPTVTITASDPSASEAGDAGRFTITRIGDIGNSLNVGYGIGGTAVNGEDYETIPSQVTIPTGQAAVSLDIRPIDDGAAEGPETVEIAIASNSEYRIGAPSAATVTIRDDDGSAAVATSEQTVSGTVVAGNYLDTRSSDDVNEAIREESYGGGQRSRLEHRWTFNLAGATTWVFEAEAHHDSTSRTSDSSIQPMAATGTRCSPPSSVPTTTPCSPSRSRRT